MRRPSDKSLGLGELIAISLGGMIGGGIFSILGVAVEHLGNAAPIAILIGAAIALLSAFSYARLATYYKDEGATYSFFKRTYPGAHSASSAVGWLVVFGYISTLALYAFTFASYVGSLIPLPTEWTRPILSGGVLIVFALLNIASVRTMGKIEDLMVVAKLLAMLIITAVLYWSGSIDQATPVFPIKTGSVIVIAALTFVSFEGFQLAIHAYNEVRDPVRNVPRAIYISLICAAGLYILIAEGALWSLDKAQIVADKEFALAAGAATVLGPAGHVLMLAAAVLATSSAISGTLFGASRLVAVIADDGFFPKSLGRRTEGHVPARAIILLAVLAWLIVLSGRLELILEFSSLTFILVSLLMAIANLKVRAHTRTSPVAAWLAIIGLTIAAACIIGWQITTQPMHLGVTVALGAILAGSSYAYARKHAGPAPD